MISPSLRRFFVLGALAVATAAHAQVVELRATINGAQEVPATSSPATGSAIMLYDVSTNTYDLVVTVRNLANTISNSHIHEAPAGANGGVVSGLGAEAVYTRSGETVTAMFHNLTYGGDKTKLLQGGAYYNLHTPQVPSGEVRGQLVAQPKRMYANIDVAQELAGMAAGSTINSNAKGAALVTYDPGTNMVTVRVNLYNFTNTLSNSHFHAAPAGSAGGVVHGIGGAANYMNHGDGFYTGTFEKTFEGDPVKLLTGGTYLNFHSNVYAPGEIRGQVWPSEELPSSRFVNLSSRGFVGMGEQVLIQGFHVTGPEPVRVLVTGKGPSLTPFGISQALSDPMVSVYDSAGRRIAWNGDFTAPAAGSELAMIPGLPSDAKEAGLVLVLPPGTYSAIVSGTGGATGVALVEITDLRGYEPAR